MGVGGQRHAPAASPLEENRYQILEENMWAPEQVWTCVDNLAPHRDSISRPSNP
jgi:hypothetical protein